MWTKAFLVFLVLILTSGLCSADENMTGTATILNVAPTCRITAPYDGQQVLVNIGTAFSCEAHDNNAAPLTYHWDFADGTTADTTSGVHAWTSLGTFTITLKVSDGEENAYDQATVYVARETGGPGVIPDDEEEPPIVPPEARRNILLWPIVAFAGYTLPFWLILAGFALASLLGEQLGIFGATVLISGFMFVFSDQLIAAIT